jgi:hypothetical protein
MNRVAALLFFILTGYRVFPQTGKCYSHELGIAFARAHLPGYSDQGPFNEYSLRIMDGFFYRVYDDRQALRISVNYSNKKPITFRVRDHLRGFTESYLRFNEWQMSVGGQHNLFCRNDLIYLFADGSYYSFSGNGAWVDRMENVALFDQRITTVSLDFGFGLKIKVVDRFFISPEVFASYYSSHEIDNVTDLALIQQHQDIYNWQVIQAMARVLMTFSF